MVELINDGRTATESLGGCNQIGSPPAAQKTLLLKHFQANNRRRRTNHIFATTIRTKDNSKTRYTAPHAAEAGDCSWSERTRGFLIAPVSGVPEQAIGTESERCHGSRYAFSMASRMPKVCCLSVLTATPRARTDGSNWPAVVTHDQLS